MSQQLPIGNTDTRRAVIIGGRHPIGARSHWLEFGTYAAPPYPFLRPALDSTAQVTVNRFKDTLARGVNQEVAKMAAGRTKGRR